MESGRSLGAHLIGEACGRIEISTCGSPVKLQRSARLRLGTSLSERPQHVPPNSPSLAAARESLEYAGIHAIDLPERARETRRAWDGGGGLSSERKHYPTHGNSQARSTRFLVTHGDYQ